MKLRNGIRKMAVLLLAGVLLLPAAEGMCVSAGEIEEGPEISLWQEEDQGEDVTAAEAVSEDDVLLQNEVTEDFGDPQEITPSGKEEETEPFSGTVSEDIQIEDVEIIEDKISYSSSDSRIVKVNTRGKITGKKAGKAKITVKAGKKKVVIVVTVK